MYHENLYNKDGCSLIILRRYWRVNIFTDLLFYAYAGILTLTKGAFID